MMHCLNLYTEMTVTSDMQFPDFKNKWYYSTSSNHHTTASCFCKQLYL